MKAANDNSEPEAVLAAARCPICGKPSDNEMRPFCSKRCADIDLHRWFGGRYVVEGQNTEVSDEDED